MRRMVRKSIRSDCTISVKQFLFHGDHGELFFFFKNKDDELEKSLMRTSTEIRKKTKDTRLMNVGILNLESIED